MGAETSAASVQSEKDVMRGSVFFKEAPAREANVSPTVVTRNAGTMAAAISAGNARLDSSATRMAGATTLACPVVR